MTPPRIGCLGEVMLELVTTGDTSANLGVAGDTYNTAVYLARSQQVAHVDYITVLGRDSFSGRIKDHMAAHNVGTARVATHPTRVPGLYAIETDDAGERRFTYWRNSSAARTLGSPDVAPLAPMLDGLSHLVYSGISLAILSPQNRSRLFDSLADFRKQGGILVFDSNYRPTLWEDAATARDTIGRAWASCDIALPSVDDEMALFGETSEAAILERFARYGVTQGALKRGALGPIAFDGVAASIPEIPVTVVDTTAAGDSFNAGYLAALLRGASATQAMSEGHALACKVIGHKGAIIDDA